MNTFDFMMLAEVERQAESKASNQAYQPAPILRFKELPGFQQARKLASGFATLIAAMIPKG